MKNFYKINKISAGSFDLNKWLYGGYEKDVVTMIAGPPGSGKTNFCMMAVCSQAKKDSKIIFIDTEGGFSSDRIKQIVGAEEADKVLQNIFLLQPVDFNEQKKIFKTLLEKIRAEHINLIVVDGIAMLYRLELGDALKQGDSFQIQQVNKEVAKQMRVLAEIARKKNIPVLITNQVYKQFVSQEDWIKGVEGETNIVGGDLFKYWSKCIIELKKTGNKRKAVLLKHRSLPQKEMDFVIKDKGIFKRRWI